MPLGTTDLDEALDAKELLEIKSKAFGSKAFKLKAKSLFPLFIEYCKSECDYRPRSLKEIEEITTKYLSKFFGNKKMSDIDESLWLSYCKRKDVGDYSNHRKVMNLFLKWARENKYYLYRPEFSIPKHKRRRRRNLTPDQIKILFEHATGGFQLFSVLTLLHQMRGAEAETIRVENINLKEKWVMLTEDKVKTKKGRKLPLNDLAIELIQEHLKREVKSPWLFPNRKDPKRHMYRSGFKTAWYTVQRKAEGTLDGLQWHDFRATGEKHAHKSLLFTDTQREKFAGSSSDIQKRIYVDMDAEDLRGLENAVQVDGLTEIIRTKLHRTSRNRAGK
jgi:site-specific recombinase XerD